MDSVAFTRLYDEAVDLLKELIRTPSISGQEERTANLLREFIDSKGHGVDMVGHNVFARNECFDEQKPTILLCSHHDTVAPSTHYTMDPFSPIVKDGKLFGLGSNDAGGALVTLLSVFRHLDSLPDLPFNVVFAATAEEEISGKNGMELLFPHLPPLDFAVIGEPTSMNAAIAEKGLVVLDCHARGIAGHAARNSGVNAIHVAMQDIAWLNSFHFPKVSPYLGDVRATTTMIQGGSKHNVVPDSCHFVVDVRTTDAYSNEEIVALIRAHVQSEVTPRSLRLNPTALAIEHPFIAAAVQHGADVFGSPTLSDRALIPSVPSVKMSPGASERSHTADEYIYLDEIAQGITSFVKIFTQLRIEKRLAS